MKMTSTGFNVGLSDQNRNSSRVLKPPGGGHSDIFGLEVDQEKTLKQTKYQTVSNIFGSSEENKNVRECTPRKTSSIPIGNNVNDENKTPVEWKPPPPLPGYDVAGTQPSLAQRKRSSVLPGTEDSVEVEKKVSHNRIPPGGYSTALW